jgi:N6-adenosine-specific RNA methylase IME4/ParB-like chromosome segregation protein Spo0J
MGKAAKKKATPHPAAKAAPHPPAPPAPPTPLKKGRGKERALSEGELLAQVRHLRDVYGCGSRLIGAELGIGKHTAHRLLTMLRAEDAAAARDAAGHGDGGGASVSTGARPGSGQPALDVARIRIGSRVRKDMGDLAGLARSIDGNGLLHPIVVRRLPPKTGGAAGWDAVSPWVGEPDHELIAGERRLEAWQMSRWRDEPIPVHVVDLASIMRGEFAENHERKNFTPSELVEIKRALEQEFGLKDAAAARQRAGTRAAPGEAGRSADQVAAFTGRDRRTIEKAEAVVAAAERDPERFGKLRADMDRSGKVDGPAKRLANMVAGDRLRAAPPPLPMHGPYRTILADVPWPAEIDTASPAEPRPEAMRKVEGRGYFPYPTMTIDEIAALDVPSIVHPDGCALWLLITNFHLARGAHLPILSAWGFEASTILTWCKPKIGHGQRLRGATEHAVLAIRGDVPCLPGAQKTWFVSDAAPGNGKLSHSQKPEELFAIIEAVTPAPRYAFLFAGASVPQGWDGHGDRIGDPSPGREGAATLSPEGGEREEAAEAAA